MTTSVTKILPKLETVFLAAAIFSYLLKTLDFRIPYLTVISVVGLALIFFLNAFKVEKPQSVSNESNQKITKIIIPKILWIGLSILTMGILFYLMNLNSVSYMTMLIVGSATVLIAGLTGFITGTITSAGINNLIPIFYRAIPALLVAIYIIHNNMTRQSILQLHSYM